MRVFISYAQFGVSIAYLGYKYYCCCKGNYTIVYNENSNREMKKVRKKEYKINYMCALAHICSNIGKHRVEHKNIEE